MDVAVVLSEWYYWNVRRKTQRFIPWVARKIPKKLQYYVIINVTARASYRNPTSVVPDITAQQLLETLEEG